MKTTDFEKDFESRAKDARDCRISLDIWTRGAHDMLRIAAFAGFDMTDLMRRCFKRTARSGCMKINIRTVETVMGLMDDEFKAKERKEQC